MHIGERTPVTAATDRQIKPNVRSGIRPGSHTDTFGDLVRCPAASKE